MKSLDKRLIAYTEAIRYTNFNLYYRQFLERGTFSIIF